MPDWGDLGAAGEQIRQEAGEELWRYLAQSARVGAGARIAAAAALAGMAVSDFRRLAEVHLLLSDDVTEFLDGVPGLLRRLARQTRARVAVTSDVRSAIDWQMTWAARAARGWSAPVFAVREPSPSADLAPNRVLRSALALISELSLRAAGSTAPIRGGAVAPEVGKRWLDHAGQVGELAARHLRAPSIAELSGGSAVAERDLQVAWNERSRRYRPAVRLHRLALGLLRDLDPERLKTLFETRLLVPGQEFRIFEIWTLARIARALRERARGELPLPSLQAGAGGAAYRFISAASEPVNLYFQSIPAPMREASRYRDIFDAYSLDVATRMPDLVLEVGEGDEARRLLVEVKASRDRGYVADGLYKLFGYLSDFAPALRPLDEVGHSPLGLLVVLGGATPNQEVSREGHSCRIATFETLDEELASILGPASNPR